MGTQLGISRLLERLKINEWNCEAVKLARKYEKYQLLYLPPKIPHSTPGGGGGGGGGISRHIT